MTTPNTWGNEYYHRLSQAMPPTPRPLPDDPGPTDDDRHLRRIRATRKLLMGLAALCAIETLLLLMLFMRHTP